jgi:hypothetical protein
LEATTPEDAAAVLRRMRDIALSGDPAVAIPAARVYFERTAGKVADPVDVDQLDDQELRAMLRRPFGIELILSAMEGFAPGVALEFLKAAHSGRLDPTTSLGTTDGGDDDDLGEGGVDPRFALLLALKQAALFSRAARKE